MSSSGNSGKPIDAIEMPNGKWVRLRPLRGNDLVALSAGDLGEILIRLNAAVIEKSWPDPLLEEDFVQLRAVLKGWRLKADEDALPQSPGESLP